MQAQGFANPRGGLQAEPVTGEVPKVVKVTTLADSGPGSLREAVDTPIPRVIVFEVSGAILLQSDIIISYPFCTIAGQTAPGQGIGLYHGRLRIEASNVSVSHLHVRPGDLHFDGTPINATVASTRDGIQIGSVGGITDVLVNHCSVSWSTDELVSLTNAGPMRRIGIHNCLLAEPLAMTVHPDTSGGSPHNYGMLLRNGNHDVSVYANLFAHCHRRMPVMQKDTTTIVMNNVLYNPVEALIHWQDNLDSIYERVRASVIGNHTKVGPDTKTTRIMMINYLTGGDTPVIRIYHRDNTIDPPHTLYADALSFSATPATILGSPEINWHSLVEMSAVERDAHMLNRVGAFWWNRDAVDARVIQDYIDGTGGVIDSQSEVGGYPVLPELTRAISPPTDLLDSSFSDGIADGVRWLQSFEGGL